MGWIGFFMLCLGVGMSAGIASALIGVAGIGLMVFVWCDPFTWFYSARLKMERKYPEYYGKKAGNSSGYTSSQSITSPQTFQASSSYTPPINSYSNYTSPATNAPSITISLLYSRFFSAVNMMREPNGTGSIMVNRNAQDGTVKIHGHYCNYECLDCTNRIASYLSYPGFFIMGSDSEDRDNINFELDEVSCTDSEFGVQSISQALYSSLPNATITGQTNRDDFCSVQFKT